MKKSNCVTVTDLALEGTSILLFSAIFEAGGKKFSSVELDPEKRQTIKCNRTVAASTAHR